MIKQVDLREVFNAIFYLLRGGIAWRMLPHDFPPWKTLYHYFRLWRWDGTWETLNARLREQVRSQSGREATPSAGVMDSQSAKTTERGDPVGTRGQEGKGAQTSSAGRYPRIIIKSQGA